MARLEESCVLHYTNALVHFNWHAVSGYVVYVVRIAYRIVFLIHARHKIYETASMLSISFMLQSEEF